MEIIKSIVDKLKLKELFAILFIAALIITFVPNELAQKMKIGNFRSIYQTHISLCMITIGAYYLLYVWVWVKKMIWRKFHNPQKIAINYMKKYMSPDQMWLLIETFYDNRNKMFRSSGMIDCMDGRRTPLESKHIIYLASRMGNLIEGFSYNIQPYALDFLNRNLQEGNIEINKNGMRFQLK